MTADDVWSQYDIGMDLHQPSEADCPLALSAFGQGVQLSATVTSPVDVNTSNLVWRILDAQDIPVIQRSVIFNYGGPQGRRFAQPQGVYPAGLAGDQSMNMRPNQDLLKVDVSIAAPDLTAVHRTWIPYRGQLLQPAIAFTGVPRAKKGRSTTVRLVPNMPASPPPTLQWYRNGVAFTPPSNPWNIGGMSHTAYTLTPTSTTPINWKVVAAYGFPAQSKTIQWQQKVDP